MSMPPSLLTQTAATVAAVLLPYQQAWVADRSQVKLCEKSRRVGLSWAEAALSALEASRAGGQDTWYLGYSQDMAREFIRDCAWWCGHYQIAADAMEEVVLDDEGQDILAFQIKFASGHRVTALSSSPRNLRGKQGRVVIDEAAFHPDLKELLKAAFALLIWGGQVSIISTHWGVDNPFNELVQDVREGHKHYSLHRITFKEALAQGLYQRICLATKKTWSPAGEIAWEEDIRATYRPNDAEELDCVPSSSGGAYLSRALIESRMVDDATVVRYACTDDFVHQPDHVREADTQGWIDSFLKPLVDTVPKRARASVGQDFGRTSDLSVIIPLLEDQGLQRRAPFVIELRNVPFKQQEQILFWLCDHLPRFNHLALDARGNGQYLAEVAMQRYGSASVTQVMLTQQWYLEHMPRLKAAFEDGTLAEIPRDSDLLEDLRLITMVKGIPRIPEGRTTGSDGGQRHGDAAVALCMAWYATSQGGGLIEFRLVPKRGYAAGPDNIMDDDAFERRSDY